MLITKALSPLYIEHVREANIKHGLRSTQATLHGALYNTRITSVILRLYKTPRCFCWNNVTAKCILIIIWYIIHWINLHCGLIMSAIVKGPNPLLRIGHNVIVIGKRRSRPHNIIKVVITIQFEKSALPVKRHFTHARLVYIERPAPHFDKQLTCSFWEASFDLPVGEREKSGASFGEDFLYWFELSLDIVLAIYNKEVLLGFLPLEGFPG